MFSPHSLVALGIFLTINVVAATSGAYFRPGEWYASLAKPPWTPPNWAFPVVWSVLFLLNAVSGWLVWEAAGADAGPALAIYAGSLVINAAWSAVFFGLRRMDFALAVVAGLWVSILLVGAAFAPISAVAAALQAPYLIWVTIAAALNWRVLQLNAGRQASV